MSTINLHTITKALDQTPESYTASQVIAILEHYRDTIEVTTELNEMSVLNWLCSENAENLLSVLAKGLSGNDTLKNAIEDFDVELRLYDKEIECDSLEVFTFNADSIHEALNEELDARLTSIME